jgi:hypothetical protein
MYIRLTSESIGGQLVSVKQTHFPANAVYVFDDEVYLLRGVEYDYTLRQSIPHFTHVHEILLIQE